MMQLCMKIICKIHENYIQYVIYPLVTYYPVIDNLTGTSNVLPIMKICTIKFEMLCTRDIQVNLATF